MHSAAVTLDRPAFQPPWLLWVSLFWLLALQACKASSDSSRAEPGPRARPSSAEARDHLERGNRRFRAREFEQAIEEYKAGISLQDVPLFHFNLAQSFRLAGQYEKALLHYDLFARHLPAADPNRPILEALVAQTKSQSLRTSAPTIEPTAAPDTKVAAAPEAEVVAAADPPGPTPVASTRNNVASSQRRATPLPSSAPVGELAVIVTPWAAVWLNGRSLPGGTPYRTKVPAGRHRLRLANEDLHRRETVTVTIKPNETTTVERTW